MSAGDYIGFAISASLCAALFGVTGVYVLRTLTLALEGHYEFKGDSLTKRSRLAGFTHRRPVFVPPWNRMDDGLLSRFAVLGLTGLSTWGPRPQAQPVPGVTRVNTHIDVVDWAGGRGFVGLDRALSMAIEHLEARRTGAADRDEATGLMTHHLAHDDGCWDFIGTFLARVRDHQAGHWLSAEQAFRP